MSAIDAITLSGVVILAIWWIVWPTRAAHRRSVVLTGALLLAGAQLATEGLAWQFAPADLCLGTLALLTLAGRQFAARPVLRLLTGLAVAAIALAAVGAWTFLRAPVLTPPDGSYPLGSQVFRWVDASRPETATADPADRRNVVAQAWYPAVAGGRGRHPAYIDGLGRLPKRVSVLPGFVLSTYGAVDTHARLEVAVSTARPHWPVVLFSPGYGAPRAVYTSLATALASRGYVVLAIDHPYEAAVTELADGRIATTVEHFRAGDPDRIGFMIERQDLRVADLRFVIDQLQRGGLAGSPLAGRVDLQHIGAAGHSFGGATAFAAMAIDPRIRAAANLDGTVYGPVVSAILDRPVLLLESDRAETPHGAPYLSGNARLLSHDTAPAWRYEMKRANHYSFTDVPLFLAPPARAALALAMGGERGAGQTHRAAVDLLAAFLQQPLGGSAASVEAAAARHGDVVGGRVRHATSVSRRPNASISAS